MKKLYSFLLATALSTTAFAETPVDGNWELTVYDITESMATFEPTIIKATATSEGNDIYWNFEGTTYGIRGYFDSSTNNIRFQNNDYDGSTTEGVIGNQYLYQKTFYVDGSDISYNMLYADYDADNGVLKNFTRKGAFNPMPTDVLGFDIVYSDRWRNQENGTFMKFYIESAKKLGEAENSINVALVNTDEYPIITAGTTYSLIERAAVTAIGYDEFDVYFRLSEKDGEEVKAKTAASGLGDGKQFEIRISGLAANKEFVLYCWAESGEYKSEEATLEFNTLEEVEPEPEEGSLVVSLPFADYGFPSTGYVPGNPDKAYAWDYVSVEAENVDDFKVYYTISANGEEVVSKTEAPYEEDYGMYVILNKELEYGVDYTMTAWAESGDIKSNEETSEFTIEKPEVKVTDVEVNDITSKSATLNITFDFESLPNAEYLESTITVKDGDDEIASEIVRNDETAEIELSDLEAGKEYNLTVTVSYTEEDMLFDSDEETTFVSEPYEVKFTTVTLKAVIIADEHISHEGATVKVQQITKVGFADDDHIDLYFGIKESPIYPHGKGTFNEADGSYEYTYSGIDAGQQMTAVIYGGKGEEGDDDYFRDNDNQKEYVFTVSDTTAIEDITADGADANARYYNLNGVEVKNLTPGTVYIKVADGKASKVLVK